jgi:hypothetical protein
MILYIAGGVAYIYVLGSELWRLYQIYRTVTSFTQLVNEM